MRVASTLLRRVRMAKCVRKTLLTVPNCFLYFLLDHKMICDLLFYTQNSTLQTPSKRDYADVVLIFIGCRQAVCFHPRVR